MGKVPNWESLFCSSNDIKMAGRRQNMGPMWKKLMKLVLGCTQFECKPNEDIVNQYREMFESRISATATEKLPGWDKPHEKTVEWSNDL